MERKLFLETANNYFTIIFTIEMIVKLLGLGIKSYVSDNFNLFDGTLVIINLFEVSLHNFRTFDNFDSSAMQALRTIRLLKIIKLVRGWTALKKIVENTMSSIKDISNFSILLLLFMFISALLGMEMYAYKVWLTLDG